MMYTDDRVLVLDKPKHSWSRSLPYLFGLISNLSVSTYQDSQMIGVVKVNQVSNASRMRYSHLFQKFMYFT